MKLASTIALMLMVLSCQPPTPTTVATTNTATPTSQDSVSAPSGAINCQTQGKLIEKFEQNNAIFERLGNEEKELEWLKITSKDGKCTILDDVKSANHYSVTFEDWDKDGMKDRVNALKWDYEVYLFDKTKNDFSRHINGRFCGDQWDFGKSKNLKYQFLENKLGGIYELYRLVDTTKTIISQVAYITDYEDNGNIRIEIRKNIVSTEDAVKFDTLKMDTRLLADIKPNDEDGYDDKFFDKTRKFLEAYWRKNLSLFMK